ncbi:unnamed protein product [Durusdinium trenchii]
MERQNAQDLSVTNALGARLAALAPGLGLDEALTGWELLKRQAPTRKQPTLCAALASLEQRLEQLPLRDGTELAKTLARLARGGTVGQALLKRLAVKALELRNLGYHELVTMEACFEALGGLQEPLDDFLRQRRVLFLKEAPLAALLRALELSKDQALLEALVRRVDALGNESPLEFDDPFLCFELLLEHQRISNSFLAAMCSWTRNHLHSKAECITAERLMLLDDALSARGAMTVGAMEDLNEALRAFLAFRGSAPPPARTGA